MGDKGNGTGLNRAVEELVDAEKRIGLDSILLDPRVGLEIDAGEGVDVHVIHSNLPDGYHGHPRKVFFAHASPEHCVTYELRAAADMPFSATMYWLRAAEVTVTQWPRHKRIWDLYLPAGREVELVPAGIDTRVWNPEGPKIDLPGKPSFLYSESWFEIKRPTEFMWAFCALARDKKGSAAKVHFLNVPEGQMPFWSTNLEHMNLRRWVVTFQGWQQDMAPVYRGANVLIQPSLCGDFSRTCLEALACGMKVLARKGSDYATYTCDWDWESVGAKLLQIVDGTAEVERTWETAQLDILPVAERMAEIYDRLPANPTLRYFLPSSNGRMKKDGSTPTDLRSGWQVEVDATPLVPVHDEASTTARMEVCCES